MSETFYLNMNVAFTKKSFIFVHLLAFSAENDRCKSVVLIFVRMELLFIKGLERCNILENTAKCRTEFAV